MNTAAPDRTFLGWCLRQSPVPHHKLTALRPDFLVISPPKTGSTWLAANLRAHPAVFVPKIKEVKYFSAYFKWLDLGWYLDQFAPGIGRVKGEASPSYAILPVETIRLVRGVMPDVKLVFLMRDPVSRAWSHARHNYRYREANFSAGAGALETISEAQWQCNFAHEWPLTGGDYLGQLRRWLSVFPREQVFVGFYESIATRPESLLREVLAFLGLSADGDLAGFPVRERVLPGLAAELSPALTRSLRQLLGPRTRELASFLRESFGLEPPPEWEVSLRPAEADVPRPEAFAREFDDAYLARVLSLEESFPSSPTPVLEGYRGHDIVYYRGRLYALAEEVRDLRVNEIDEECLRRHQAAGRCLVAPSLPEVKGLVDEHVLARLEQELLKRRAEADRLDGRLRRLEAEVERLTGWYTVPARWLRSVWAGRASGRFPAEADLADGNGMCGLPDSSREENRAGR
ncbi:MAG TPA: sulfotransferase domain-containing protein [Gemmataceae bacterium]|nr:sulfotransferase domain-containing protein [Gemmataceae bacterium]